MRIHRVALIAACFYALLATVSINTYRWVNSAPVTLPPNTHAVLIRPAPVVPVQPDDAYIRRNQATVRYLQEAAALAAYVKAQLAAQAAAAAAQAGSPLTGGLWPCIEMAESTMRPYITSGLYGILVSTWQSLGYSGVPGGASLTIQNEAAMRLYDEHGWRPWNDSCTGT